MGNWTAEEHTSGFCEAFVVAAKRERLLRLLSGRRRSAGVVALAHPDCIDLSRASAWTSGDPVELADLLRAAGAPAEVYLISNYDVLDHRTMMLTGASAAVLNLGLGTVISAIPGKLAFYEGEYGKGSRYVLKA